MLSRQIASAEPSSHLTGFHILAKPSGPICNLDCKYCFYLEKENLYPATSEWRMSDEVVESYIRQYIEAQSVPAVWFAWQGGEPTILGVDYFRKIVELQGKYANGKRIENAFQTNGILLDDRWGESWRKIISWSDCRSTDHARFMTSIASIGADNPPSIR
jgi:sulfatase maturation enzyme AslB (radical SAM superfamily)